MTRIHLVAILNSKQSLVKWQKEYRGQVDILSIAVAPCVQSPLFQECFIATITFSPIKFNAFDFQYWDMFQEEKKSEENGRIYFFSNPKNKEQTTSESLISDDDARNMADELGILWGIKPEKILIECFDFEKETIYKGK